MAAPGEFFPQQFALGILQMSQNIRNQNAQLAEMRRTRAANNFLEKERLRLQRAAQIASQEQAQGGADLAEARFQEDVRRRKLEEAATVGKSFETLRRGQPAFFANFARDKLADATKELNLPIHEIEIPGRGVLAVPVSSSLAPEYQKALLENQEIQSRIALNERKAGAAAALQQWRQRRTQQLGRVFKPGMSVRWGNLLTQHAGIFGKRLAELEARILAAESLRRANEPRSPELEAMIQKRNEARNDLRAMGSAEERKIFDDLQAAFSAALEVDRGFISQGGRLGDIRQDNLINPPFNSEALRMIDPDVAKLAKMDSLSFARKLNPQAPWEGLNANFTLNVDTRPRRDESGRPIGRSGSAQQALFHTTPEGLIPLNGIAVQVATHGVPNGQPPVRAFPEKLHPNWRNWSPVTQEPGPPRPDLRPAPDAAPAVAPEQPAIPEASPGTREQNDEMKAIEARARAGQLTPEEVRRLRQLAGEE